MGLKAQKEEILMVHALKGVARKQVQHTRDNCNTQKGNRNVHVRFVLWCIDKLGGARKQLQHARNSCNTQKR
jgi:hypothetical protein